MPGPAAARSPVQLLEAREWVLRFERVEELKEWLQKTTEFPKDWERPVLQDLGEGIDEEDEWLAGERNTLRRLQHSVEQIMAHKPNVRWGDMQTKLGLKHSVAFVQVQCCVSLRADADRAESHCLLRSLQVEALWPQPPRVLSTQLVLALRRGSGLGRRGLRA